jgi:7,8-dihydro-6-hydroxymethylpterin-pyrophosphokinase
MAETVIALGGNVGGEAAVRDRLEHAIAALCDGIEVTLQARSSDFDLIAYDDVTRTTPTLTLPHPRALERAFVLLPLSEIAPEGRILGVRVWDALAKVEVAGIEKLPPR